MNDNNLKQKIRIQDLSESNFSEQSKTADVYDVIHSQDLEKLYKKNALLLSRLSSTGRQNGILQSEVHSLLKQRSKLDVKNVFLKTKVDSLKEQVFIFAKQQKKFNEQSIRLKKELNNSNYEDLKMKENHSKSKKIKTPESQKNNQSEENIQLLLKKKEQELLLLTKRETVFMNQIKELKRRYNQSKKYIQSINNQEPPVKDENPDSKIMIESLKNDQKNLLQENKFYRDQMGLYKNQINSHKDDQNTEQKLHHLIQILKAQQEDLLSENEFYENQIDLYKFHQEENKVLSENCHNLRSVITQQEEGFQNTMLSFHQKYSKTNQELKSKSKRIDNLSNQIIDLKNSLEKSQKNFKLEKEAFLDKIQNEKKSELKLVLTELEEKKNCLKEVEKNLNRLKVAHREELIKIENQYSNEIQSLKFKLENASMTHKEDQERALQALKNEYEARIDNLNNSYEKRLQHIRTEMENDLLSEKRKYDAFQSIKDKQIKEIQDHLTQMQKDSHDINTNHFALENSNKQTMNQLKKEISKNEHLEMQNKNLQNLWHEIQSSLEQKEQQIQSLQKLNKNLSLSMNQNHAKEIKKKKQANFKSLNKNLDFISADKEKPRTEPLTAQDILADIHFD